MRWRRFRDQWLERSLGKLEEDGLGISGREYFVRHYGTGNLGWTWSQGSASLHPGLERFSNSRALFAGVQGGFYLMKKPLNIVHSVNSNWRTAVFSRDPFGSE
jgi:hypothetical protein